MISLLFSACCLHTSMCRASTGLFSSAFLIIKKWDILGMQIKKLNKLQSKVAKIYDETGWYFL